MPAIVLERQLYVRERADGLYLPITYLLAKMLDELMLAGVVSVGIAAAAFWAIGLKGSFGLFWLARPAAHTHRPTLLCVFSRDGAAPLSDHASLLMRFPSLRCTTSRS